MGATSIAAAGMLTPMFEVDSAQQSLMSFCVQVHRDIPNGFQISKLRAIYLVGIRPTELIGVLYQDHLRIRADGKFFSKH